MTFVVNNNQDSIPRDRVNIEEKIISIYQNLFKFHVWFYYNLLTAMSILFEFKRKRLFKAFSFCFLRFDLIHLFMIFTNLICSIFHCYFDLFDITSL